MVDINSITPSYTQVLNGLWISNEAASQSAKFMHTKNISFVVNCSKNIPNKFDKYIRYLRLNVNDPGPFKTGHSNEDNIKMIKYIPMAVNAIHEALQRGENVLVHCHAGAQRSAHRFPRVFDDRDPVQQPGSHRVGIDQQLLLHVDPGRQRQLEPQRLGPPPPLRDVPRRQGAGRALRR